jgi:MFS family permease
VSLLPEPLKIAAFRHFWFARLSATIGQMAMVIVIGWQVYDIARATMGLKEAALRLGIIGLVQFIPLFLLTLVTGWAADRVDRRWIARASVALELACAVALALFAWTNTTTLFVLYTVAALLGVARAFAGPALGALAPNLVPREILPRAIALSSIAWQTGAILGPALGGYLYAAAPFVPYVASAALFAAAFVGLLAIPPVARAQIARGPNPWAQMVEGLRYVRGNRLVLGAISLDLFAVLLGVARAFAGPALGALAPNLVPREILPRAIALSSIAWQTGAILGPALGGYLYAAAPFVPYVASAALFAVAFVGLLAIPPVPRTQIARGPNPWAQMVEGRRHVRGTRLVLGAISLDLFAVLLGGATAMLPVFARDVLHAGPEGLGHLRAAPAIGATLTAAFFSVQPLKHNVGLKMLAAVGVFGTATIVFGWSRSMPLSLTCLALLGAADMFSVYVRQSLIQLYTPDQMRGRVGAVSSLFISASNELGEAESGFLGALIGPVAAVIAGGVGALAVVFLWSWWFPELRLAKTFDAPDLRSSPGEET